MDRDGPAGRAPARESDAVRDALRLYGHDIRAAMSDVIGGLRLVDTDRLAPDLQTQIDRVRVAGETLAELIDSAISLISEPGAAELPPVSFDFRSFLAEIELRWLGRAREQGLGFALLVDPQVPERIRATRIQLDRILGNLIANGLKFSDEGTVSLKVGLKGGDLGFCVRDQGPGFSETALERLFTREGRPKDAKRPGSGLGLHISKELADRLGGSLTVCNIDEGGACVSLRLPRESWDCREQTATELPDLSGLSVLVAEDNETNQILLRQMLDAMGARMILARDGQEALDALRDPATAADLALIDIEMPRLSGIDVMRALRTAGGCQTPLVALTAYVMRENREAIYAAGADGVIAKPIRSVTAFGHAILRHVRRGAAPVTGLPPAPVPLIGTLDRNRFEAILQAAGQEGRGEFLSHLLQDLRQVRDRLRDAVRANDTATARAQSHILISLSGAVGADRLQDMAESLNAAAHRGRLTEAQTLVATCDEALGTLIGQVERRSAREARM